MPEPTFRVEDWEAQFNGNEREEAPRPIQAAEPWKAAKLVRPRFLLPVAIAIAIALMARNWPPRAPNWRVSAPDRIFSLSNWSSSLSNWSFSASNWLSPVHSDSILMPARLPNAETSRPPSPEVSEPPGSDILESPVSNPENWHCISLFKSLELLEQVPYALSSDNAHRLVLEETNRTDLLGSMEGVRKAVDSIVEATGEGLTNFLTEIIRIFTSTATATTATLERDFCNLHKLFWDGGREMDDLRTFYEPIKDHYKDLKSTADSVGHPSNVGQILFHAIADHLIVKIPLTSISLGFNATKRFIVKHEQGYTNMRKANATIKAYYAYLSRHEQISEVIKEVAETLSRFRRESNIWCLQVANPFNQAPFSDVYKEGLGPQEKREWRQKLLMEWKKRYIDDNHRLKDKWEKLVVSGSNEKRKFVLGLDFEKCVDK